MLNDQLCLDNLASTLLSTMPMLNVKHEHPACLFLSNSVLHVVIFSMISLHQLGSPFI